MTGREVSGNMVELATRAILKNRVGFTDGRIDELRDSCSAIWRTTCSDARVALEAASSREQSLILEVERSLWQPIETAPLNKLILAAIHHGKCYVVCQARRTEAGAFDTMEDSCVGWRPHPAYKPAFWMPLPEPPALSNSVRQDGVNL